MLKAYIYNQENDNFVEIEENLLYHDICVILDEERKSIFLWKGPEINEKLLSKGKNSIANMLSKYPDYKLVDLADNELLPSNIRNLVSKLLEGIQERNAIEKYKFSRLSTIRAFFLLELIGIGLYVVYLVFLSSVFIWLIDGGISSISYEIWLLGLKIPIFANIFVHLLILLIGIIELENDIIIISIISIFLSILITIYLTQGIFLFIFQDGSSSDFYLISPFEIVSFFIVNLLVISILIVPNIIKIVVFFHTYRDYIFL